MSTGAEDKWKGALALILRWLGRVWNGCLIAVAALEIIGPSDVNPETPWHEFVGPFLLFGGAILGFVLTWRHERAAGWAILGCYSLAMVSANLSRFARSGVWLLDIIPLTALFFATPGVLYLLADALSAPPRGEVGGGGHIAPGGQAS